MGRAGISSLLKESRGDALLPADSKGSQTESLVQRGKRTKSINLIPRNNMNKFFVLISCMAAQSLNGSQASKTMSQTPPTAQHAKITLTSEQADRLGQDMIIAIEAGAVSDIEGFLRAGANVNSRDKYGMTALMAAAGPLIATIYFDIQKSNDTYIFPTVRTLLAAGADIDAQDNRGWTALMWAARKNNAALVQLLLNAGSNRSIKAYENASPFSSFTIYDFAIDRPEILEVLADFEKQTK